jgi:SSS family transporter
MSLLDWLVIGGYLALVLTIGLRVSRRSDSADDLLLAGRGLGPTAVMLSLIATELSAATFIGVPQNSFAQMNWYYLQFAFGALIAKVVLSRTLVPLYHRLGVKTVYGLIEQSFGPIAWRGTALAFVVGRILASGVRLYLAAIAFSALTQVSMEFSVLICAVIAGIYSGIGGIRSVIATDVIQGGLFIVSGLALLFVAVATIPGGVETFLDWIRQNDSTRIILWPSEVARQGGSGFLGWWSDGKSLPVALIGGFFLTMATHGTDHDMVQRLLTCKDGRSAGRALVFSGILNIPLTMLFLLLGTALACSSAFTPPDTLIDSQDVVPLFARDHLPSGLLGLFLAGLLAAAMSSLDSAICAISATWSVDVLQKQTQDQPRSMRIIAVVITALLALTAMGFSWLQQRGWSATEDLVTLALSSMTIIYGALLGVFLCAAFLPRRGSGPSAVTGLVVGSVVGLALFFQKPLLGIEDVWIAWPWWIVISAPLTAGICAIQPREKR